jgi:hypothetical protein
MQEATPKEPGSLIQTTGITLCYHLTLKEIGLRMKYLLCLLVFALMTGCASTTTFTALPKEEQEFLLPKQQLSEKYSEIPTYEKRWRGFTKQLPTEQSLISELGEPRATRKNWLSPVATVVLLAALQAQPIVWGLVIAIRPDVPEKYYFKRGNYCVEANMDRTFIGFYTKHMTSWDWKENAETCE